MFDLLNKLIILAIFIATPLVGCYSGISSNKPMPYKIGISAVSSVQNFMNDMEVKNDFDKDSIKSIFDRVQAKKSIIDEMSKPYEKKIWSSYRDSVITDKKIELGRRYISENYSAFSSAKKMYGVTPSVVAAIIGIETEYGANMGGYREIDALSTIAFSDKKYADFYRRELEQFLLSCREQNIDVFGPQGKFSGAMGIPGLMPTTYRRMAVDGDGDGRRDIWKNHSDAILTLSHFLAKNGWQPNESLVSRVGNAKNLKNNILELQGTSGPEYWLLSDNFSVLQRYNKDPMYVMLVAQLSQAIDGDFIESVSKKGMPYEMAGDKGSVDPVMEKAKSDCKQLYKVGTRDYGRCVMELIE